MGGRGLAQIALLIAVGLLQAACGGGSGPRYSGQGPHDLVPHPTYKIGAPYTVKGVTYYPRVDLAYDATGMASWYGEAFEGQYTANGEVFDLNQITAAHRTLPLPSIVEVTNLQNNKALRVRINDRGPFSAGRILDVSRHVAELLGFERSGSAMVRVRVLKDESLQAEAAAERGIISNGSTAFAAAVPVSVRRAAAPPAAAPRVASPSAIPPGGAVAANAPAPRYGVPAPVIRRLAPTPVSTGQRFRVESPLYRVQIGPVATQEEADRALNQMIQSGYRDAHIVMN